MNTPHVNANLMVAVGSDLPPALPEEDTDWDEAPLNPCRCGGTPGRQEYFREDSAYMLRIGCAKCGRCVIRFACEAEEAVKEWNAATSEARVEPVACPLSGARSDLPSMPPPASSLPVSAPEVRMLEDHELVSATTGFPYSLVDLRIVQRLCAEAWGLKLATTEPKP